MEIVDVLEKNMRNKDLRVIAIEGKGSSFCSGDDLKSMGPDGVKFKTLDDGSEIPHQRMLFLIREIQKPVVALLHGYCLGAGFELSLACDIRLAADDLRIGDHRVSRAICVLCGASWFLPRIVGFGRASEIIMTGKHLNAKEALNIGLVAEVYPASHFKEKSREYLKKLTELPTRCIGYNKAMLNFSQFNEMIPSLRHEFKLYCKNIRTRDFGEGMKSFLKKREPKFTGR
jgi:2-(1,2-epoxy-1,2-dihydrophenyl)acetyl-CoA isomerase